MLKVSRISIFIFAVSINAYSCGEKGTNDGSKGLYSNTSSIPSGISSETCPTRQESTSQVPSGHISLESSSQSTRSVSETLLRNTTTLPISIPTWSTITPSPSSPLRNSSYCSGTTLYMGPIPLETVFVTTTQTYLHSNSSIPVPPPEYYTPPPPCSVLSPCSTSVCFQGLLSPSKTVTVTKKTAVPAGLDITEPPSFHTQDAGTQNSGPSPQSDDGGGGNDGAGSEDGEKTELPLETATEDFPGQGTAGSTAEGKSDSKGPPNTVPNDSPPNILPDDSPKETNNADGAPIISLNDNQASIPTSVLVKGVPILILPTATLIGTQIITPNPSNPTTIIASRETFVISSNQIIGASNTVTFTQPTPPMASQPSPTLTAITAGGITFSMDASVAVISGKTYSIGPGASATTTIVNSETVSIGSGGVGFATETVYPGSPGPLAGGAQHYRSIESRLMATGIVVSLVIGILGFME